MQDGVSFMESPADSNDFKVPAGLSVIFYRGREVLALNDHMPAIPIPLFFE